MKNKIMDIIIGMLLISATILSVAVTANINETANSGNWWIETVDSQGTVGMFTSLALDSNGYPHISYYEAGYTNLKYAKWNGSGWDIETVDSNGNVGWYTSIALDSDDYPHISYYDDSNDDLKYAKQNGSIWIIGTVDSQGNVGTYTSLALDSNDYAHISYRDADNGNLKHAKWDGSAWNTGIVDSQISAIRSTSIAVDSNDDPHISYHDFANQNLKYAKWDDLSGWSIETVDSEGSVGSSASIALDSNDYAHISYCDTDDIDLKYADWDGSEWNIETVDSDGNVGTSASIALDSNDYPHISYSDIDDIDLKYADWDGSEWNIETVDSDGNVGDYTSIAVDSNDNPHISYRDATNMDLKYAKQIDNDPPETPDQPVGPTEGSVGVEYCYSTNNVTDPDGDDVQYLFDWGSGEDSGWIDESSACYTWDENGTYDVKVKARDSYEFESDWSDPLTVTIVVPELEITEVTGGMGVSATIKNVGEGPATNLEWNIKVTGGFLDMVDADVEGNESELAVDATVIAETGSLGFLHLGPLEIKVTAEADNADKVTAEATAFIIGPFVLMVQMVE